MNRRLFLASAAASTGGLVAGSVLTASPAFAQRPGRGGGVKTISGSNSMTGYTITAGSTLRFDPKKSTTLELTGNLINYGRLEMRPARSDVVHTIRFNGVDESKFVGGGLDPISSDVGLWVMGAGVLDIQGSTKTAWNRTGADPTWRAGDEIVVAPTAARDSGRNGFAPFTGTVPSGPDGHKAEVLNLSRNVVIEGTPTGRSHIFIRSTATQTIRFARLNFLGPRKNDAVILARWCLHFHHAMDASRGSLVEGVVATKCGAHVFVPHMSHGITFRNCIAYDVVEAPYWWDGMESDEKNEAHDILFDSCVAALVDAPGIPRFKVSGFLLQAGSRNTLRNCVATGVQGTGGEAAGYSWSSRMTDVWTFEDCIVHNNKGAGVFAWQNDNLPHRISRLVAYRNGSSGVRHGAYVNAFRYGDMSLIENGSHGFDLHSRSKWGTDGVPLTLSRTTVKNTSTGLLITGAVLPGPAPTTIEDWAFVGCQTPVEVLHKGSNPGHYAFNRCTVNGSPLKKSNFKMTFVVEGSTITIDGKRIL